MRATTKSVALGMLAFLCVNNFGSIDIYVNDRKDVVLEVRVRIIPKVQLTLPCASLGLF